MNQTNSRRLPLRHTSSLRLGRQAGCALSALALLLGGCAQEAPFVRSSLEKAARNKVDTPTEYSAGSVDQSSRATSFYQTPKASAAIKSAGMKPPQPPAKRADDDLVAAEVPGLQWLLNAPKLDTVAIDETGWPTPLRVPDPRAFALHKAWLASRPDRDAIKKPRDLAQARAVAALVREHMPHLPFSEAISSLHGDVRGLIDML